MPVIKTDQDHKRFEFRNGLEEFRWRGMRTNGSPATNPPGQLRLLINGRMIEGDVLSRGGWSPFNSSPFQDAGACFRLVSDYQLSEPKRMWIVGDGCAGISSSVGFYLAHFDEEQDPDFQRARYFNTQTNQVVVAAYNGSIYIAADSSLYKLQMIVAQYGTENFAVSGTGQESPIATFSGFQIKCMLEFDGKLFLGLDAGAGASKVVCYDGTSIFDNDLSAVGTPYTFASYRIQGGGDGLVLITNDGANNLKIRTTGDSPGTWANLGTVTAAARSQAVSYKDVLYIASGATTVQSWDGSSVATARTVTNAQILGLCVFNNLLYFGYKITTTSHSVVGKFDGSTWTDTEKDLTTQFADSNGLRVLCAYRDRLVAGSTTNPNTGAALYFSPGLTTSGTWIKLVPNASNNGDIESLVVI